MNNVNPAVKKTFDILKVLSLSEEGMGLSKMARDLKIAKSTTHRIVSALKELGIVRKDPSTKKYSLVGSTLIDIGCSAYSQGELQQMARPVMEALKEKVQETVFLGIRRSDQFLLLDTVEARKRIRITSEKGQLISLLAGSMGKVFLASIDEPQAIDFIERIGLSKFTKNTISDTHEYLKEIKRVRHQGYATDYEEYIDGVRAVACPIKGLNRLSPQLCVVGFKASLSNEKMKKVIKEIKEAARVIARHLGGDHADSL